MDGPHNAFGNRARKFHPESFAPYTPDFKHMKANDYAALDFIDASVCAIMIEAVQGEGG